jgi:hypothetical protein
MVQIPKRQGEIVAVDEVEVPGYGRIYLDEGPDEAGVFTLKADKNGLAQLVIHKVSPITWVEILEHGRRKLTIRVPVAFARDKIQQLFELIQELAEPQPQPALRLQLVAVPPIRQIPRHFSDHPSRWQ